MHLASADPETPEFLNNTVRGENIQGKRLALHLAKEKTSKQLL